MFGRWANDKEEIWRVRMGEKLVVVGGGAGGPSAAAKAKRVDASMEVTVLQAGDYVSYAS
jgi:NADH dehydrogenase FAD-containing subunit